VSDFGPPDAGKYYSDKKVAELFGLSSGEQVQRRCRTQEWPHLRVGKRYRFTLAHLQRIEALCEVAAKPKTTEQSWGVVSRGARTAQPA